MPRLSEPLASLMCGGSAAAAGPLISTITGNPYPHLKPKRRERALAPPLIEAPRAAI